MYRFSHLLTLIWLFIPVFALAQPEPIVSMSATDDVFEDRVELNWVINAADIATSSLFQIYRDGALLGVAAPAQRSYVDFDAPLRDATTSYCVEVVDGGGSASAQVCDSGRRYPRIATNFRASDGSRTTDVLLTWTDNSLVEDYYFIQRSSDGFSTTDRWFVLPANTSSYADTDPTPGVTYWYHLILGFDCAEDPAGPDECAFLLGDSGLPLTDVGLRASVLPPLTVKATNGLYPDRVKITWEDQSDEDGFRITRGTALGLDPLDVTTDADVESYVDVSASPGTAYVYCVQAFKDDQFSAQVCTGGQAGGLVAPTDVAASEGTFDDRVRITWAYGGPANITRFEIFRGVTRIGTAGPQARSYDDLEAPVGVETAYGVRAVSEPTDASGPSESTTTTSANPGVRPAVLAPSGVTASQGTFEEKVELGWKSASTSVMVFKVYRKASVGPTPSFSGTTLIGVTAADVRTFADFTMGSDETQDYCVSALTVAGAGSEVQAAVSDYVVSQIEQLEAEAAFSRSGEAVALDVVAGAMDVMQQYGIEASRIVESSADCTQGFRSLNPPSGVAATVDEMEDYVRVTWVDQSSVERGYRIYRKTGGVETLVAEVSATRASVRDTAGTPGQDYTYLVRSFDEYEDGLFSESADGAYAVSTRTTGRRTLAPPTDLEAADGVSETEVTLSWVDESRAETGYEILRDGIPIATVGPNATSYSDTSPDLDPRKLSSTYGVRAVDHQGPSATVEDVGFVAVLPPASVSASDTYEGKVVVTWVEASSIAGLYRLSRNGSYLADVSPGTMRYEDTSSPGGEYCVEALISGPKSSGQVCDDGVDARCELITLNPNSGNPVTFCADDVSGPVGVGLDVSEVVVGTSVAKGYGLLSADGDHVAIGGDGTSVRLYNQVNGTWSLQKTLTQDYFPGTDFYGRSLDMDGELLAVATQRIDNGSLCGTASEGALNECGGGIWIYQRGGTNWELRAGPSTNATAFSRSNGSYGYGLGIDGSRAAVTHVTPFCQVDSNGNCTTGPGNPILYNQNIDIFEVATGSWVKRHTIEVAQIAVLPELNSRNLDVDGNHIIWSSGGGFQVADQIVNGIVYLYSGSGTNWTRSQLVPTTDLSPDPYSPNDFGENVALHDEWALVSDPKGGSGGVVYVFKGSGSNWQQHQVLFPPDGRAGFGKFDANFWGAMSINEEYLHVPNPSDNTAGTGTGSVYVYRLEDDKWEYVGKLFPDAPAINASSAGVQTVSDNGKGVFLGTPDSGVNGVGVAYYQPLMLRPTGVTASDGRFEDRIQIQWRDTNDEESGYRIYRREDDGALIEVGSTGPNVTAYNDFSAPPGNAYAYCVRAFNSAMGAGGSRLGESYETCDTGWRPANGAIAGRISAPGGGGTQEVDVELKPGRNNALLFDGSGGFVAVPDNEALDFKSSDFSVEFWVNRSTTGTVASLIGKRGTASGNECAAGQSPGYWDFRASNLGGVVFEINDNGRIEGATKIDDGAWHHVAGVRSGSTMYLYVDGVLQGSDNAFTQPIDNAADLWFGLDPCALAGGDGTKPFQGRIDDVRIWKVARTQSQLVSAMSMPLTGGENGLVGYFPLDQGARSVAPDLAGSGANGSLKGGVYWSDAAAPLAINAATDVAGNYTIDNVRYGDKQTFTVTPADNNRVFSPAFKTITLSTDNPVQNEVDFLDETAFTVAGRVLFQNTTCPVPDVRFYLNDAGQPDELLGTSDSDGTYALSVDPSDPARQTATRRKVIPVLGAGDEKHVFTPASFTYFADRDTVGNVFHSSKTRFLRGWYGGGGSTCSQYIGDLNVRVFTEDGCYDQTTTLTSFGNYDLELPPQPYLVSVSVVPSTIPSDLDKADVIRFFENLGTQAIDLTAQEDTLDFVYHAPLVITLTDWPDPPSACVASGITVTELGGGTRTLPNVPVLSEGNALNLTIRVEEDYGAAGTCAVEAGALTIFDNIGFKGSGGAGTRDAATRAIEDGQAAYGTVVGPPDVLAGRFIEGVDRSFQKSLSIAASVPGREPVTETFWAIIDGMLPRTGTFVSARTDELPIMTLHDPPGSGSYAYLEEGFTTCKSFTGLDISNGAAGVYYDLALGLKAGAGLGVFVENGAGVSFTGRVGAGGGNVLLDSGCEREGELVPTANGTVVRDETLQCGDLAKDLGPAYEVCMTTTERWATSAEPQHVGDDIFFGVALNLLFATEDKLAVDTGACTAVQSEVIGAGFDATDGFATTFVYDEYHIQNALIGDLERLGGLVGESTTITGDDADGNGSDESISIRNAVKSWKKTLYQNEKNIHDATAETASGVENRSFSAGTEYEYATTADTMRVTDFRESSIYFGSETEAGFISTITGYDQRVGAFVEFEIAGSSTIQEDETRNRTVGYVLYESTPGDYLTLDVGADPVHGTPAFRIKSGRTSAPWEYECKLGTEDNQPLATNAVGNNCYADPGVATQKRDNPKLEINPPVIYGADSDVGASFELTLINDSESKEGRPYKLRVPGESNVRNLGITVTGGLLGGDRLETFTLNAGEARTIKLDVFPSPSAYSYEDVQLMLYPAGDFEIWGANSLPFPADTVSFSVYFTPPCTEVSLLGIPQVWSFGNGDPALDIIVADYTLDPDFVDADLSDNVPGDLSSMILGAQYRRVGTPDWVPIVTRTGADLLTNGLASFSTAWTPPRDGAYEVRAFSSCNGDVVASEVAAGLTDTGLPAVFGTPEPRDGSLALGDDAVAVFAEQIDCASIDTQAGTANVVIHQLGDTGAVVATLPSVEAVCDGRRVTVQPAGGWDDSHEGNRYQVVLLASPPGGTPPTDAHGNEIASDIAWQFVVQRSSFSFNPVNVVAHATRGAEYTIETALANGRPEDVDFTLDAPQLLSLTLLDTNGDPTTTTVDLAPTAVEGTIPAQGEVPISFTVPDTLDVGTWTGSLVALGAVGGVPLGSVPFRAEVHVACAPPAWTVNTAAFEFSMNLSAQLYIESVASVDPDDRVVALVGGQVRGVAANEPIGGGAFRVPMTIYGNADGEVVTFQVWDQSSCTLFDDTSLALSFAVDGIQGNPGQPVTLEAPAPPVEGTPLAAGWTWFSINTIPSDPSPASLFLDLGSDGDVVKSQNKFSQYDATFGWSGSLAEIVAGAGYMARLSRNGVLNAGGPAAPETQPIPVKRGWNWIGYNPQTVQPLSTAFDGGSTFTTNDLIKSQFAFAQYDGAGWIGSLTLLEPGQGYLLHLADRGDGDVAYNTPPPSAQPAALASLSPGTAPVVNQIAPPETSGSQATQNHDPEPGPADPLPPRSTRPLELDACLFPEGRPLDAATEPEELQVVQWSRMRRTLVPGEFTHTMTLTAALELDGEPLSDELACLTVRSGDELRALGRVQYVASAKTHLVFLTIYGTEQGGEPLTLEAHHPDWAVPIGRYQGLIYSPDAMLGTPSKPEAIALERPSELPVDYVLEQNYPNPFNPQTTIRYALPQPGPVKIALFDLLGRRVAVLLDESLKAGWHEFRFDATQMDLASGVYFYQMSGGEQFNEVKKMVLLR